MKRSFRQLAILFFVIGVVSLFLLVSGIILRYKMDVRRIAMIDTLSYQQLFALDLTVTAKLIVLMVKFFWITGIAGAVSLIAAQLMVLLNDSYHISHYMDFSDKTVTELVKSGEKDFLGLLDRVIPMIGLITASVFLLRKWLGGDIRMTAEILSKRTAMALPLCLIILFCIGTLLVSLLISIIFLTKNHSKEKRMYDATH